MSDDSSDRAHARVGEVLNDKWTLERLIGVGGMGAVYAGVHRNGTKAAVKVLHRYLAKHDEVRTRFLREGYAANRVDHPAAVKVTDDDIVKGGPDDGTAYLVMELLRGESLERRSQRGVNVTEREFLAVAEVVLEVLEAAHANGVVHRDIKPDNIFISRDADNTARIKVLDFGLAKVLEGQSTTQYGVALGTPSFMSPEQAAGRNDEVDGRTDLFALAATGFRLITGRRIHEGANSVELVLKMGQLPAPRIRTVKHDVTDAFADVIDRALEFRRENRYESAAAMRAEVKSARAVLDVGFNATSPAIPTPPDSAIELSASNLEPAEGTSAPLTEKAAPQPLEATVSLPPETKPVPTERTLPLPVAAGAPVKTLVLPVASLPALSTPTPPEEASTPTQPPEASLAPIPMGRSYMVPALVVAGLLVVFAGVALVTRWSSDSAPEPATAPAPAESSAADEPTSDASSDVRITSDAGVVMDAVAVTRPRAFPPRHPMAPWKPLKRGGKH